MDKLVCYKYRKIDLRSIESLINDHWYYPSFSQLNDPFDDLLHIENDLEINIENFHKVRDIYLGIFAKNRKNDQHSVNIEQCRLWHEKTSHKEIDACFRYIMEHLPLEIRRWLPLGGISFSLSPTLDKMWAFYGDEH